MTPTPEAIEAAARARLAAQGYAPSVLPPDALWLAFNKEHEMKCVAAAIAAYESAMGAAGWVRVPVEPTEAMLKEGNDVGGMPWDAVIPPGTDRDAYVLAAIYRAMIAARPTTPQDKA